MQVPTDSEMLLATLKMERRAMLAIPQLPSTFSADVAAITGATHFLRQACGHSDFALIRLSGTPLAQLNCWRHADVWQTQSFLAAESQHGCCCCFGGFSSTTG